METHWIPMDKELWKVENYKEFLKERRQLLAKSANEFLNSLVAGKIPDTIIIASVLDKETKEIPGGIESEEEEKLIKSFNEWVLKQGLPEGEFMYELVEEETKKPLATLDLFWPDGMQEGFSQPVALLINEEKEIKEIVNRAGIIYFTDIDVFKTYVKKEILAQSEENIMVAS